MFSERSLFSSQTNRLSRLLARKRQEGCPVLDLTESNPTRVGFRHQERLLEALSDPANLDYRPTAQGALSARQAIASHYRRQRGRQIDPQDLLLTASTSEAYSFLFHLLANPGDSILVPEPGYPLFEFLGQLESLRLLPYPLHYSEGWHPDLTVLETALSERPRALLLVNPNNPTGSYLASDTWDHVQELCNSFEVPLIVDEVFFEYAHAESPFDPLQKTEGLTFFLNGLSKTAALPQIKLAWILLAGSPAVREQAKARLEIISDTYLSVSAPAQTAAPTALLQAATVQEQIHSRVLLNLRTLANSLEVLHVEGGWYATIVLPQTRSEEKWVLTLLQEENVLVHPGYFYRFPREAYLIVSLLPETERFQEGIGRIERCLERHSGQAC